MTNMMINARIGKIGLLLIVALILSVAVSAQASQQRAAAATDPIVQSFVAEAHEFGLEIEPGQVSVTSKNGSISAQVSLAGTLSDEDLDRGVDLGFVYLALSDGANVPNGYYKVQLQGHGDTQRLSFLDKEGKSITTSPVSLDSTGNSGGTSARLVYVDRWGDGWSHTTVIEDHWPGTTFVFIDHGCCW